MAIRTPLSSIKLTDYINQLIPLQTGFDMIKDHVVITDPDAHILYANKAVEEQTGFPISQMIGKNPGDLWGGNMSKEFYEKMWHTIKVEKKPFVGEMKNSKNDGTELWQELHISPVLDENENIKYFIAIEPNISDRKKREEFKEGFVSMFGHQLRSPLTTNRWILEWLIDHDGLSKEQAKEIEDIYENDQKLSNLINDMLMIFQFQKESLKTSFDLADEIERILEEGKKLHPDTDVSFSKEDHPYSFLCNKNLTVTVFENIIANAFDYTPKEHTRIAISLKKDQEGYLFSCTDNGIGIPENEQKEIFNRFYRGSNAKEFKKSGIGLGLFIVKMIADNFAWKVSFESTVGIGTTFFVKLKV